MSSRPASTRKQTSSVHHLGGPGVHLSSFFHLAQYLSGSFPERDAARGRGRGNNWEEVEAEEEEEEEEEEEVKKGVDPAGSFPEAFRIGSSEALCIFLLLLPLLLSKVCYTLLTHIVLIGMIWHDLHA